MSIIPIKITSSPHRVLTVSQTAAVTGLGVGEINRRCQALQWNTGETLLDYSYIFPNSALAVRSGVKVIVLNQKALDWIRKRIIKPNKEYFLNVPGYEEYVPLDLYMAQNEPDDESDAPVSVQTAVMGRDMTDLGLLALIDQVLVDKDK